MVEVVRHEWNTLAIEELVHELDPVETKRMQEAFDLIDCHDEYERGSHERVVHDEQEKIVARAEHRLQREHEEHAGELRVREGQGPKTKVRSRVRHSTERVLNCLDHRVNEEITKAMIMVTLASERRKQLVSVGGEDGTVVASELVIIMVEFAHLDLLSNVRLGSIDAASGDGVHQEHDGNASDGDQQQSLHDLRLRVANDVGLSALLIFGRRLLRAFTTLEEHADQGRDDTGRSEALLLVFRSSPVGEPFDNDHVVHEAEQSDHHSELREGNCE